MAFGSSRVMASVRGLTAIVEGLILGSFPENQRNGLVRILIMHLLAAFPHLSSGFAHPFGFLLLGFVLFAVGLFLCHRLILQSIWAVRKFYRIFIRSSPVCP
jgi:hypothetical protein